MKKNICAALIFLSAGMASFASDLVLWYQRPISYPNFRDETQPMGKNSSSHFMDEALPIGNGRSGALISGGVSREDLVLNEDSLWSGDENRSGDYGTMGTYQMFGHLIINLDGHGNFSNYRRDLDIGDAAEAIASFMESRSFQDYVQDRMLRSAVERQFEIIGEAMSQLARLDSTLAERIPNYRRVIGFRNLLIHGYDRVDASVVWRVIEQDLPSLRVQISALLADVGDANGGGTF